MHSKIYESTRKFKMSYNLKQIQLNSTPSIIHIFGTHGGVQNRRFLAHKEFFLFCWTVVELSGPSVPVVVFCLFFFLMKYVLRHPLEKKSALQDSREQLACFSCH
jgi:hypothetical protein